MRIGLNSQRTLSMKHRYGRNCFFSMDVNTPAVTLWIKNQWSPTKRGPCRNKENWIERNKMKACEDKQNTVEHLVTIWAETKVQKIICLKIEFHSRRTRLENKMAALSLTRDSNMATMTSCKRKLYEAQQRENLLTAKRMQQNRTIGNLLKTKRIGLFFFIFNITDQLCRNQT